MSYGGGLLDAERAAQARMGRHVHGLVGQLRAKAKDAADVRAAGDKERAALEQARVVAEVVRANTMGVPLVSRAYLFLDVGSNQPVAHPAVVIVDALGERFAAEGVNPFPAPLSAMADGIATLSASAEGCAELVMQFLVHGGTFRGETVDVPMHEPGKEPSAHSPSLRASAEAVRATVRIQHAAAAAATGD